MAAAANIFQSLVSPEAAGASPNRKPTEEQPTGLFAALLATAQPQSNSTIAVIGAQTDQISGQAAKPQGEISQPPISGAKPEFAPTGNGELPTASGDLVARGALGAALPQSASALDLKTGRPLLPVGVQSGNPVPAPATAPTARSEPAATALVSQHPFKEPAIAANIPNADGT